MLSSLTAAVNQSLNLTNSNAFLIRYVHFIFVSTNFLQILQKMSLLLDYLGRDREQAS